MDEILRQVAPIYIAESTEQVDRIIGNLMNLEHGWDTEAAEGVFRDAHSLKGASSSLGLYDLENLAHNLEEVLGGLRHRRKPLPAELLDACIAAMDAAKQRFTGIAADDDTGKAGVLQATAALGRFVGKVDTADLSVQGQVQVDPDGFVTVLPAPEADVFRPPGAAQASEHPAARDGLDDGVIRVSTRRITGLEQCLGDMRTLQGRLDRRLSEAQKSCQALDDVVYRRRHAAGNGRQNKLDLVGLLDLQRALSALRRGLREDVESLQQSATTLGEDLDAMRMVDVTSLSTGLAQAVREAGRRTGRVAQMEFDGAGVQVDRRLLEEIKHPLLHLVRNAVAHGIETPAERQGAGKEDAGRVRVRFLSMGAQICVCVQDDGRGIHVETVQQRAVELGLVSAAQAAEMSSLQTFELLFRPGFSTTAEVNEISGRGVGLDVVRDAVTRMRGHVRVESTLGQGTIFTLQLPLSIASCEALLLREGAQTLALPLNDVATVARVPFGDLHKLGGRMFYETEDGPVPLAELSSILGMPSMGRTQWNALIVVLGPKGKQGGLLCEDVLSIQPIVLRPLPNELQAIELLNGVSVSPSGTPYFVLASHVLLDAVHAVKSRALQQGAPRTILVADDSLTTRSLLRSTLEASGFVVLTAADGDEALRLAETHELHLVVSDVRMPRLDGFELTQRLRARPQTREVPVVLFSALDSAEERDRGPAAGANAYISKSEFDRGVLIDVVNQLLEQAL